jgi:hypothetical protein
MKVKLILPDGHTTIINAQGPSWAKILKMQKGRQKNGPNL